MKNRLKHKFTVAVILFGMIGLCTQTIVQAQTSTSGENSGVINMQHFDTRTLSMGNATASDLYGRPSIGINPAISGLYLNKSILQISSYHSWRTNLLQHQLTVPTLSIGNHHFTTSIGFSHEGYDLLNYLGNSDRPVPDVSLYHAQLAYAYSFSDVFSMGTLLSGVYTGNDEEQSWGYTADIGLMYAPAENITYGLVFRGIGSEVNYEIIETGATTLDSNFKEMALELGATFRFPIEERTYMSLSFANEKRFGDSGIWYKTGLELLPSSFISLRGGAIFNIEQSKFIPRGGFGLNFKYGSFNYMIAPKDVEGEYSNQIGITVQF